MGDNLFGTVAELLVLFFGLLLPLALIFGKAGRSPWLAALVLIPVVGILIALRMLAYGRWPAVEGK